MKEYLKKGGIRLQWLLSYLALLLLPFLFGILIFAFSMNALQQEAEEVQYQSMKQVGAALEGTLDTVAKMGSSILSSNEVNTLSYVDETGKYSLNQRVMLSDLKTTIKNTLAANDMLSNLYVYFPKTGYILGSTGLLFITEKSTFGHELGISAESLVKEMEESLYHSVHMVAGNMGTKLYYSSCSDVWGETKEQDAILIACLSTEKVQKMLELEGVQTILWQEEGGYLAYGESEETVEEILVNLEQEKGRYKEKGNYIIHFPLDQYDLSVLHVIPQTLYQERLMQALYLLMGYVVICLVVGFVLMRYFLKKNYSPVKKLLNLTQKIAGKREEGEEFVQIQETVERLLDQYSQNRLELAGQENTKGSMSFYRLLNGKNKYSDISEEDWEKIQKHVPGPQYVLYSINLERVEGEWESDDTEMIPEETRKLLYFVVGNVAEELLQERGNYYGAAVLDSYVFLLDGNDWKGEEELREISNRMNLFLYQNYEVMMSFSVSGVHTGREGIRECWQEINELNHYREEIFESFLFYGTWKSERLQDDKPKIDYTPTESRQLIEREEAGMHLADQVAEYIENHYSDKLLSGGMLAENFGLSQSNLTQKFKRKKDVSIMEYIDYVRLENAKQFLEAGYTVKETADKVGYYNTRPLIRIFRNIEGVTPAEYQSMFARK